MKKHNKLFSNSMILFGCFMLLISFRMQSATITLTKSGWWNKNSTWPNGVRPTENDDVIVPDGISLTMIGTCRAKGIRVMGKLTALDFQEEGTWVDLRARYIMVMGGSASLEIGKQNSYYKSNKGCLITLTGSNPGEKIPGTAVDSKAIMVMNGAKAIFYGKPKKSWVKIGAQTPTGSNSITLAEAVDWEIGDEVVISSNRVKTSEAETRVITAISGNKKTISFNSGLQYPRMGEIKNYSNGSKSWVMDTRAEVGLLSRNITIQGEEVSAHPGYGGHVMIMNDAKAYADNIELARMGQRKTLGRYPWHWHLLSSGGNGQFLRNSAIHRSSNRGITVHGTGGTTVHNNVVFDHIGHGVFLEDGSEMNNVFTNNLIISSRKAPLGEALLDSEEDRTSAPDMSALQNASPSSFWITNPNNTFRDNVVAGSEGTAYWLIFPDKPTGLSGVHPDLKDIEPYKLNLKEFRGNTAHSCASAFDANDRLNTNHRLRANVGFNSPNAWQIRDFTTFSNRVALYTGIGTQSEDIVFDNLMASDNEMHMMFATRTIVKNALFVADTKNGLLDERLTNLSQLVWYNMYDGAGRVYDSHMVGWNDPSVTLFRQNGAAQKRINHLFKGLTYNHDGTATMNVGVGGFRSPTVAQCQQIWSNVLRDLDGTLTRTGVPNSIVTDVLFYDLENVYQPSNWTGMKSVSNKFVYLKFEKQNARISTKNLLCGTIKNQSVDVCNLDAYTQLHLATSDGGVYEHSVFCDDLTNKELNITVESELNSGDDVLVKFKGFGRLNNVSMTNSSSKTSIQAVKNSSTSAYYVIPNGDLYAKFVTTNSFKGKRYIVRWDSGTLPTMNFENESNDVLKVDAFSLGACSGLGSINFEFDNGSNTSRVEFSIDGGNTFPYSTAEGKGSYLVEDLAKGTYETYARRVGSNCFLSTGVINVDASAKSCKLWEFNTANDFEGWVPNGNLSANVNNGSVNYTIQGGDPYLTSQSSLKALARVYPFVRLRLKTPVDGFLEVFWSENNSFSASRRVDYNVEGSDEVQEILVPMSNHPDWKNIINRLRVDLQFPQGQTGEVDLISLEAVDLRDCKSVWKGEAVLDNCGVCSGGTSGVTPCSLTSWSFNTDNDSEGWTKNAQISGTVSGGTYNLAVSGGDPNISSIPDLGISATEYPFVRVRMKSSNVGDMELFWGRDDAKTFRAGFKSVQSISNTQGEFVDYVFDMTGVPEWKDVIYRLRLDPQPGSGQNVAIDEIFLEKEDKRDCLGIWEGTATIDDCVTSTIEKETIQFNIYPNPSHSGTLNFSKELVWSLNTLDGKQILSGKSKSIDVSNLKNGIYLLKTDHGIRKIVIEQ